MDSFSIIQHYFTKMACNFCQQHFDADGIRLIREDQGIFLVSVYCNHCEHQIGVAMVGMEPQLIPPPPPGRSRRRFSDPELTPRERKRLSQFAPITENDVIDAYREIENLGSDWVSLIPPEIRERCTVTQTESPDE